jgi:hypothetical protein
MMLKGITLWLRRNFLLFVFSCDKFRSYITVVVVRVDTYHDGLKEILERTDVKPRMIRFQLHIVQMKEEQPKN